MTTPLTLENHFAPDSRAAELIEIRPLPVMKSVVLVPLSSTSVGVRLAGAVVSFVTVNTKSWVTEALDLSVAVILMVWVALLLVLLTGPYRSKRLRCSVSNQMARWCPRLRCR